jgi:putative tryptophan/tyrosine transport system substrate-binding protein
MSRQAIPSLPGSTRQSILLRQMMDARVEPAHDGKTILDRRRFIAFLAGAGTAPPLWPHWARAQQAPKLAVVGALVIGNTDPEQFWREFRQGLRDLGYIEGQNIRYEFRSAHGQLERLPELAAELVRLNVDVIVTWFTPTAHAAKQATHEIPIVMADTGDPVGTGLVASLPRPGGNVTGIASVTAELAGKSVQLIRDMLPSARRVSVLGNATDPFVKPFLEQIDLSARATGTTIDIVRISSNEELESAFAAMDENRPDAVIVQPSLPSKRAAELALERHVAAVSVPRWFAEEGGLMSYSPKYIELYRRAAAYADKILKGAQPADLPVEQPTHFELVINLRTAKALGLTIPPDLLARADEVIE